MAALFVIWLLSPGLLLAQAPPTAAELGLMQGSPPPADKIVTAENFIEPPWNRWGLAHVREIVPTRNVPVSGPPSALPQRPAQLDNLKVDFGGGRSAVLSEWLEAAYTDAFIVLHHGNVVYERYYNGQQIVSTDIARRIRTERNAEVFSTLYEDAWYGEVASAYHDQWWSYAGVNAVAALGIHGQFIYIHSDADVVIARHSSDPDAESERVDAETALVMHAISRHLGSL